MKKIILLSLLFVGQAQCCMDVIVKAVVAIPLKCVTEIFINVAQKGIEKVTDSFMSEGDRLERDEVNKYLNARNARKNAELERFSGRMFGFKFKKD